MTEETTENLDPIGDHFQNALELYGDQGYFVMSEEAFSILSGKSDLTVADIRAIVVQRAKDLDKSLVFTIQNGLHADLGESYWVTWWPGGAAPSV